MSTLPLTVDSPPAGLPLAGLRVAFVGRLAAVGRSDARQLVLDHGGIPCDKIGADVDLVVVGEEALAGLIADEVLAEAAASGLDSQQLEVITETQLYEWLGLVDDQQVHRQYTPAMLADLLGVPVAVIRRWHRRGLIVPARVVQRLPYFDFQEVATARRLAELVAAGVSPQAIEKKLEQLARLFPSVERPLAQLSAIVEGKQILLRQGDGLIAPGGQLWFDFDAAAANELQADRSTATADDDDREIIATWSSQPVAPRAPDHAVTPDELLTLAGDLDDLGQTADAVEMLRSALAAGGPKPEVCFQLAELLYRQGDLAAARERYYMAIELDEDYVEARANLGCVLAEQGQRELALAAWQGALAYHPDYPDAHYHLARHLVETGRESEAVLHWREFLRLAPESPWAEEARMRLDSL